MTPVWWLHFSLEVVLAIVAVALARRARVHRAFAAFACYITAAEVVRPLIRSVTLHTARPLSGIPRALAHADELLYVGWYGALAMVAVHYFLRWRASIVAIVFGAIWAYCLNYPRVSGQALLRVYHLVAILGAGGAWFAFLAGVVSRRMGKPRLAHYSIGFLAAAEGTTIMAVLAPDFVARWPAVNYAGSVTLVIVIGAHIAALVRGEHESKGTPT